jgi:hypothetical protein
MMIQLQDIALVSRGGLYPDDRILVLMCGDVALIIVCYSWLSMLDLDIYDI